ncbi:MAG TPA: ferrous iron transport protein B [Kofleriaceae bacterium]|nr:ferrous iron transport protein B [Kofleriaceae bacterium]
MQSVPPPPLVAVAGNPNTGKTTLFNALTGARAKVGNYPGVTVERRTATLPTSRGPVELLDVPGCYSLLARTGEEQIALASLAGLGERRPDAVVFCVDATQATRSSYLVLQAQELGLRAIVALTMVDEAGGAAPDAKQLAAELGCEVVPMVAKRGVGVKEIVGAIERALAAGPAEAVQRWTPSPALADAIARVKSALPADWPETDAIALWALMSLDAEDELVGVPESLRRAVAAVGLAPNAVDDEVVHARWKWLDAHVQPLIKRPPDRTRTQRVDRILLHRAGGFAIFVAIMFVVFMSLFAWTAPVIDAIDHSFAWSRAHLHTLLPDGIIGDFLADGVIAGVGSVMVFLPQILLLFFFIGLLEDCGYMARVAFLMDRIMKAMNLHGRAFVPMLSGYACAVPAILATRTMERQRDRLLTMLVVPLMTCSARLPVYTLIIGALFAGSHWTQGFLMVGMYGFSVLTALTAAVVLSRVVKPLRAKRLPFVIELPPYRLPSGRDVLRQMWDRTAMFLREAGTVILGCTIALWALLYFPRELPAGSPDYDVLIQKAPTPEARTALENEKAGAMLANSYGGRLGRAIEPAIAPMGFDWKIGVGVIGAFAAREVFISTMGVVYSVGSDVDEDSPGLRQAMKTAKRADGKPLYTPLVGLCLMIFFALACQCMSTLAVVKRETGGYKWPLFLFAYMTVLAWVVTTAVYQGGRLLGFS